MSAALQSLMRVAPQARKRSEFSSGLFRFVAIGAFGALAFVLLSSTVIGLASGVENWVVNTCCYAALVGPVYLLHRRYSFRSEAAHRQALPRYVAVQGMALLLAALFSYLVHGVLVLPSVAASMLVIALTSGVNFMVLRGWAFTHRQPEPLPA